MTRPERLRFDLTTEPWIPCEALDGARIELGLEAVLLRAHELAAMHDESPLATAMIHRLLLAILHRVVDGPRSFDAWKAVWNQPRFDADRVHGYFERWRHRFDLFDAERPFLQVPKLAEVLRKERDGKDAEPIAARRLALECSHHSNVARLLDHGGEDQGLTPAEALRALLGFQGFGPGGRILNDSDYPKGCPLRPGAVVLARGDNLRATLLLNLLVPGRGVPHSTPDDAPAWEQDRPSERVKRVPHGWLDALTWQPRRVELLLDPAHTTPLVTHAITGAGLECDGDWTEPMHALLVRDAKRGPDLMRFTPDRSVWRDATALFQAANTQEAHRRPAVCEQMAWLVEDDVLHRADVLLLDLYGLASDQTVIDLWRTEQMPLPLRLLTDGERLGVVQQALEAASHAEKALGGAVWRLARFALASSERNPDKKDIRALVNRLDAKPRYWAELAKRFDRFLRDVGRTDDADEVLATWKASTLRDTRYALASAANQLGTQARALQARALAECHLSRALAELAPLPPPSTQQGVLA